MTHHKFIFMEIFVKWYVWIISISNAKWILNTFYAPIASQLHIWRLSFWRCLMRWMLMDGWKARQGTILIDAIVTFMFGTDFLIQRKDSASKCGDASIWLVIKIPQKKHESGANSTVPTNQCWVDASVIINEYDKTLFSLNICHSRTHLPWVSSGAATATTRSRQPESEKTTFDCLSVAYCATYTQCGICDKTIHFPKLWLVESGAQWHCSLSLCVWEIVHSNIQTLSFPISYTTWALLYA